jgi:valyl-tRNA synthetase
MRIPPSRELDLALSVPTTEVRDLIDRDGPLLRALARVAAPRFLAPGERLRGAATAVVEDIQLFVPLEGIVDLADEAKRLAREIDKVGGELAGVERKLADPKFRSRAPEDIVEEQEQKATLLAGKKAALERSLRTLDEARAG